MLNLAISLKNHNLVNLKTSYVHTDNLIFKCHYRVTVIVLLVGVLLLSSKEYIGENIRCIFPEKNLVKVIERFCFFMGTFTVVKHHNRSVLNREIAHPGVGPYVEANGEDEIKRHVYYQWVPLVLTFQAICFYMPHLVWKSSEKGMMKALVKGIKEIRMINEKEKRKTFDRIQLRFRDRIYFYRSWTICLIACEVLNLVNLVLQVLITDAFLGHQFLNLGPKVYWDVKGDEFDPLDVVFPKVTKCSFSKFGPSGSLQYHDILCVMALNIVNEKIYCFLWFWYVVLFILSVYILIWRLVSYLLRKSISFNFMMFKFTSFSEVDRLNLTTVMRNVNFGEWMFIRYLSSNMSGKVFNELIAEIADCCEDGKLYRDPPPRELQTEAEEGGKPLVE